MVLLLLLLLLLHQQPENFFYTREFEIERAKVTRWFNYRWTCSSFNGKIVSPFSLLFLITFFSLLYRARCQSFLDSRETRIQSSNRGYKWSRYKTNGNFSTIFLTNKNYNSLVQSDEIQSIGSIELWNYISWKRILFYTKCKITRKKKKKKKTLVDPLQKKCPLPGKFSGKQAIPIRERNKVWRRSWVSKEVSISMGWKSIGESVEAAVVTGGETSLPLFHGVSHPRDV